MSLTIHIAGCPSQGCGQGFLQIGRKSRCGTVCFTLVDELSKLIIENRTKLTKNIATDVKSAGQASKAAV